MSLNNIFAISGSAMSAQTIRLNTVASNIANVDSVASSVDETYRARKPVFAEMMEESMRERGWRDVSDDDLQSGVGVQVAGIVESDAPLQPRYEPDHPMSNEEGYVFYPNVNPVEEMADMMSASRSFQTNVEVMNSAKSMMQKMLSLGQS
ncbi:flagellar basal body rod protein FlgC [Marinomonas mediterranea]|jgi:flagellar basal-body rod protein FlgC|uniref:Flagellar basal-body rod protein FlgC n=1 Tax=Marinomonas mediterranea (strain ATCC 700492 / JCM 21426 / NBRC 103028 / MMB-1) TaxID=717774 RepID=F2K4U0_MARM1|nr:flagellar basal body rod protein FlgC [Marinomonas mediterranea]ADZ92583.1 flagellar basal-body rod protein FlgC [Marinomonas mediterranea MMB-1]WCN10526.1 flagellar basal body rod protein FlgC [Marinomonas mediterranea]WCN14576.1 flagellar basal body rod protein FlgC [Marinomonas mediterranea]WCN18625.1 flagellar basal body rod protein FlgC [Marinomonas mediterranea MMB-1]